MKHYEMPIVEFSILNDEDVLTASLTGVSSGDFGAEVAFGDVFKF